MEMGASFLNPGCGAAIPGIDPNFTSVCSPIVIEGRPDDHCGPIPTNCYRAPCPLACVLPHKGRAHLGPGASHVFPDLNVTGGPSPVIVERGTDRYPSAIITKRHCTSKKVIRIVAHQN